MAAKCVLIKLPDKRERERDQLLAQKFHIGKQQRFVTVYDIQNKTNITSPPRNRPNPKR